MKLSGVILCGGRSIRMGEDKGLVQYKGKYLIEYPLEVLKNLTDKIYLSTANSRYQFLGYPLLDDIVNEAGPIGGIYSCIHKIKGNDFFFIACDTPNVTILLAKEILKHARFHDIVVPKTSDGRIHPLFGYYSKGVLFRIKEQIEAGNYKMLDLLKKINTYYLEFPDQESSGRIFQNINTKDDVR